MNSTLKYFRENFSEKTLSGIPGDLKKPFVGDTLNFLKDPIGLFTQKQEKYGDIFKMRLFGMPIVFFTGAEATKYILIDESAHFSSKEGWDFSIGELFHGGLMLKDGEHHKHHRSIMQSAFKKDPMADYLQAMLPVIENYFKRWKNKKEVLIFPEMKQLTLQLAGKVFFGVDFSDDLQIINQSIINVVKAATVALPFPIPFTTYWKGLKGRKVLEKYFKNLIADRRKRPTKDMLGMLCIAKNEEGDQFSDKEIVDHLIFLLMAAHDTTASTLTSLFYELAKNRDWQEKIQQESINFYQNNEVDFQNLNKLDLLANAIKETLRMHPPLILIPRKTTQEKQFGTYQIPPETGVSVLIFHNHFKDQTWQNAEKFDPARFESPRAEHKKCPHAYSPFGAGNHHCLGFAFAEMQIKLVISYVLNHYSWSVPENYTTDYRSIPIQEPKDGLPVTLKSL